MVYAALLALAALDAAGYGMLAPIIPEIAERTGTGPGVAGALVACFAVGQLVGYPIAGRLAQQRAARSTLAVVLAPVGIGVAGAVSSVPIWFVVLALAGAAFGLSETGAMGVLLDEAGPERIVTAWVVWSQLWAVGYLVGPATAGLVAETAGFAALGLVPLAGSLILAWTLLQRE